MLFLFSFKLLQTTDAEREIFYVTITIERREWMTSVLNTVLYSVCMGIVTYSGRCWGGLHFWLKESDRCEIVKRSDTKMWGEIFESSKRQWRQHLSKEELDETYSYEYLHTLRIACTRLRWIETAAVRRYGGTATLSISTEIIRSRTFSPWFDRNLTNLS